MVVIIGVVVTILAMGGNSTPTTAQIVDSGPPKTNPQITINPRPKATEPAKRTPPEPTTQGPPEDTQNEGASQSGNGGGDSIKQVYDYVLKSTVFIVNLMERGAASGSGEVVDVSERLILTNDHVVAGNTKLIVYFPIRANGQKVTTRAECLDEIKNSGGKTPDGAYTGEVIYTDPKLDLALVRVDNLPPGIEALSMCKAPPGIGENVQTVGNPGASDALWVSTVGHVRQVYPKKWKSSGGPGEPATDHDAEIVETDLPTNHGDSGGPLVNARGELVGVTHGGSASANLFSIFLV